MKQIPFMFVAVASATVWSAPSLAAATSAPNTTGTFQYNTQGYRGVSSLGTLGLIAPTGDSSYLSAIRSVFDAQESKVRAAFSNPNRTDQSLRTAVSLANQALAAANLNILTNALHAKAAATREMELAEKQKMYAAMAAKAVTATVATDVTTSASAASTKAPLASGSQPVTQVVPASTDAADLLNAQKEELKLIAAFQNFKPLAAQFASNVVSATYKGRATASSAAGYKAEGISSLRVDIGNRRFAGSFSDFYGSGCSSMNAQKCQDFASKLNFTGLTVGGMVTPNGFVYKGEVNGNGASGSVNGLFRAAGAEGTWSADVNNRLGTTGATIANSQAVTGTWRADPTTTIAAPPVAVVSSSPVASVPTTQVAPVSAVTSPHTTPAKTIAPLTPAVGAFSSWAGTALSGTALPKKDLVPKGYTPFDSKLALYSGTTTASVTNLRNSTNSTVTGEVKMSVNFTQGTVTGAIGNFVGTKDSDTANFLNAGNVNVTATIKPSLSHTKEMSGTALWIPSTAKASAATGSFTGTIYRNSSSLAGDAKGSWGVASKDFKLTGAWNATTPAVKR